MQPSKALQRTANSAFQLGFGSLLASTLGASATSAALLAAAERPVRWAAGMTIQDLGSLGELIAALATVATLAYLAVQIRQNTAVVRTSNYAELTSKTAEVAKQIAGDPELMDIWQRGLQDYRGLSDRDQGRFHMVISQFFVAYQLMMQLHSRGLVDTQFFEQQLGGFGELFKSPGVRQWWSSEKRWYSAGYRDFVDRKHAQPAAQHV